MSAAVVRAPNLTARRAYPTERAFTHTIMAAAIGATRGLASVVNLTAFAHVTLITLALAMGVADSTL